MNGIQLSTSLSEEGYEKACSEIPDRSLLLRLDTKQLYVKHVTHDEQGNYTGYEMILLGDNEKALNAIVNINNKDITEEFKPIESDNDDRIIALFDWLVLKGLTVTTDDNVNHPSWYANLFLGQSNPADHNYILFSDLSEDMSTCVGHILLKSKDSAYTTDIKVCYNYVMNQLEIANTNIPLEVWYATLDGKQYLALKVTDDKKYDVLFTGWASSTKIFTDLVYTDSDLTNLAKAFEGDVSSSKFINVKFGAADRTYPNIVDVYNNWDFEEEGPLFLRIARGSSGRNAVPDTMGYTSSDYEVITTDTWRNDLRELKTVCGNSAKLVYLDMRGCRGQGWLTAAGSNFAFDHLPGLYGLKLYIGEQLDRQSYWNNGQRGYFSYNPNLRSIVLPYRAIMQTTEDIFRGCTNLVSVKLNTDFPQLGGDHNEFLDCPNLEGVYITNTEEVLKFNGYGATAEWFADHYTSFYVPRDLVTAYRAAHASDKSANLWKPYDV